MADKNTKDRLFRKDSLDKLSSPEQLDLPVRVTGPKGWLALVTLGGLVVVAVLWGIFGSIPTKVRGSCVLIKTGGVHEVSAASAGRITDIAVSVGDVIKQGQRIARMAQPGLLDQFHSLKLQRDDLKIKNEQRFRLLRQQGRDLETLIANLEQKVKAQEELVHDGLITHQQLLTTKQNLADSRSKLSGLSVTRTEYQDQMHALERQMDVLRQRINLTSAVVSPYTGRVLAMRVNNGQIVNTGAPILDMELIGNAIQNLESVIYVSAEDGKKVKPAMQVFIAPSTVKTQKYGYMEGRITRVAQFPSNHESMMRILQNQSLVNTLTAGSAVLEMRADLVPSPTTESGFKWTSPGGPPTKVQPGTLCKAQITVSTQRPISLVIPAITKFLGT